MSCSYLNNGKRDEIKKFVVFALIFQNVLAYCVALMVYQIGGLVLGEVAFGPATVVAFIVAAVILYFLSVLIQIKTSYKTAAGEA